MAIALSGGINIWGEFPGDTRNNFTNGLTTFLLLAGWQLAERVAAFVSGTYGSNPSDGTSLMAGSVTYTWKNVINNAVPDEVLIGLTLADSLANMVSAINYVLVDAGTLWSNTTLANPQVSASVTGSTLTLSSLFPGPVGNGTLSTFGILTGGGFKANATSPQLQAGSLTNYFGTHAYMYDKQATNGGNVLVNHKMLSPDETLAGNERSVTVASGQRFRVVANRCQFFCYKVGTSAAPNGSMISGGVPWIAPSTICSGDVTQEPVTVAFWSSGDYDGFLTNSQTTPRTVVAGISNEHYSDTDLTGAQVTKNLNDANGYVSTDACWNSDVTYGNAVHDDAFGGFQLVGMQPPFDYSNPSTTSLVDAMRWHGKNGVVGQRMLVEPLVGWTTPGGGTDTTPAQVRGQLWDSWIGTDQVPADTVQTFGDGKYYVALTHVGKMGTLWHIVPALTPTQFESFQASYAN